MTAMQFLFSRPKAPRDLVLSPRGQVPRNDFSVRGSSAFLADAERRGVE